MCHPRTVVTGEHLTKLVSTHLVHSSIVGLLISFDRNLSSHTTNGSSTTLVASLNEQVHVGLHKGARHRHRSTIRQYSRLVVALTLNE